MTINPEAGDRRYAPLCPLCRDAGAVIVPHPQCVDAGNMRLIGFDGGTSLRTIAVRCDRVFGIHRDGSGITCPSGSKFTNLPTHSAYMAAVGAPDGLPFDAMRVEFYETRNAFAANAMVRPR